MIFSGSSLMELISRSGTAGASLGRGWRDQLFQIVPMPSGFAPAISNSRLSPIIQVSSGVALSDLRACRKPSGCGLPMPNSPSTTISLKYGRRLNLSILAYWVSFAPLVIKAMGMPWS